MQAHHRPYAGRSEGADKIGAADGTAAAKQGGGGGAELVGVCALSGLVFAGVENVLYLCVYIPDELLTAGIVAWRLCGCTVLHVVCATLSGLGLARAWRAARDARNLPQMPLAVPFVAGAMVLHGLYNFGAIVFELLT